MESVTWTLPEFRVAKESEYMDDKIESVECACGLWYLAGSGEKGDPFLSAAYDPVTGKLEYCGVCHPAQGGSR